MRLKTAQTSAYERNPLVEVVTQLRFSPSVELSEEDLSRFQQVFKLQGYDRLDVEPAASISLTVNDEQSGTSVARPVTSRNIPPTYHFSNTEGTKKVSINPEFFAYSCTRYTRWSEFRSSAIRGFEAFCDAVPSFVLNRVGLRYKDLIDRNDLGLKDAAWKSLLSPSLAGVFLNDLIEDSHYEVGTINHSSQSLLVLDDCKLFLQTALLLSTEIPPRDAFLIDSDFYHESSSNSLGVETVGATLDALHRNAASLFRNSIKYPLHHALGPVSE